jgi:hypothetical protein
MELCSAPECHRVAQSRLELPHLQTHRLLVVVAWDRAARFHAKVRFGSGCAQQHQRPEVGIIMADPEEVRKYKI